MNTPKLLLLLGASVTFLAGCPTTSDTDKDDTDSVIDTDSETETDVETDTETETDVETDTETDTETETDTDTDTIPIDDTYPDTALPPIPGPLMITEICDYPGDARLRWIELWNPGPNDLDLDGYRLRSYLNGSATPDAILDLPAIVLRAGRTILLAPGNSSTSLFVSTYGNDQRASPERFDPFIAHNGNDAYELVYTGGQLIDVYGARGVNGSGTAWEYTEQVVWRDPSVTAPSTTWQQSQWIKSSNLPDDGSPGWHPPDALDTSVVQVDTDDDTFEPACVCPPNDPLCSCDTYDTGLRETGSPAVVLTVDQLDRGDLVISEIMVDPQTCAADRGQYLEITSNRADRIDITGLRLVDATANRSFTINTAYEVRPGEPVVFWLQSASPHCYIPNGFGVPYGTVILPTTGTDLRITTPAGLVIDEVDFTGWTVDPGRALQFDGADLLDADANDDESAWCSAQSPIVGSLDFGNPSYPNDQCPIPDTNLETDTDTDTGDSDSDVIVDTDPVLRPVDDLAVGDLVMTEILAWAGAPCTDERGEFIEVYNATLDFVDLSGLVIRADDGTSVRTATVDPGAVVRPEDVAVLYLTPPAGTQHCFRWPPPIQQFRAFPYSATLLFNLAGETVSIVSQGGSLTLDTVDFRTWTPQAFQRGAAWSLDRDFVDVSLNDNQAYWCAAGPNLGSGNIGTAGALLSCPTTDTDTDTAP